jgi:hypothetical protein
MKLIRATRPLAVDYMKEFFLEALSGVDNETFAAQLKAHLEARPRETFILQAWSGNNVEEDKLVAFVVATKPEGQRHVFIHQAWSAGGEKDELVEDRMFFHLLMWTRDLDVCEIRCESGREPTAFQRRWNFQPFAVVLSFSVPDDFEVALLRGNREALIGRSVENVERQRRNSDDLKPDTSAESSGVEPLKSAGGLGQAIADVRRRTDSPAVKRPAGD